MSFFANLSLFAAVDEVCKSIKNWQSYSHGSGWHTFWLKAYFGSQCWLALGLKVKSQGYRRQSPEKPDWYNMFVNIWV